MNTCALRDLQIVRYPKVNIKFEVIRDDITKCDDLSFPHLWMVLYCMRARAKSYVTQKRVSGLCVIVLAQERASTHDFLSTLCGI